MCGCAGEAAIGRINLIISLCLTLVAIGEISSPAAQLWSQAHFNVQLTLLGHSVGNRLIVRAAPMLYGADIDLDTCRHYILGYENKHLSIARLYVSRADKVLHITQRICGGYYRLGEHVTFGTNFLSDS